MFSPNYLKPVLLALAVSSVPLISNASDKVYISHVNLTGKFSSDRSLGEVDLFIPVAQSDDSLLFLDIRGVTDNKSANEVNAGLGFRHLIDDQFIIGGYGFYDSSKSSNGFDYNQYTFGLEVMSEKYDFRYNYYNADNETNVVSSSSDSLITGPEVELDGTPYLSGNAVFSNGFIEQTTTINTTYETSLDGWDAEFGVELINGFRAFAGYYNFDASGSKDISGPRLRAEWNLTESFDRDSSWDILATLEHTDDDRGSSTWAGLRLNIPIGGGAPSSSSSRLMNRMTEYVRRDVDIVSAESRVSVVTIEDTEVAVKLSSDDMNYWFVNNATGSDGNGEFETPFRTLAEAQFVSEEGDLIFIYSGNTEVETGYNTGFKMKNNQSLIGEGVGLNWEDTVLIEPGERPLLSHSDAENPIVELANDNSLSGFDIDGRNVVYLGIYGEESSGVFEFKDLLVQNTALAAPLQLNQEPSDYTGPAGGIYIINQNPDESVTLKVKNLLLSDTSLTLASYDPLIEVETLPGIQLLNSDLSVFAFEDGDGDLEGGGSSVGLGSTIVGISDGVETTTVD